MYAKYYTFATFKTAGMDNIRPVNKNHVHLLENIIKKSKNQGDSIRNDLIKKISIKHSHKFI